MEVHAHTHTPRKKWTHYFWEFLMLFLAVFCGFTAENIREHQIEHRREVSYMKSLRQDLVGDIEMINGEVAFAKTLSKGYDSLSAALYAFDGSSRSTMEIYRLYGIYARLVATNFNDRTMIQLRNSGAMRLISEAHVADAIANYWNGVSDIEELVRILDANGIANGEISVSIFNGSYIEFIGVDTTTSFFNFQINPSAHFMKVDKDILINYANRTRRMKNNIGSSFITMMENQKKEAIILKKLLEEEYHLK